MKIGNEGIKSIPHASTGNIYVRSEGTDKVWLNMHALLTIHQVNPCHPPTGKSVKQVDCISTSITVESKLQAGGKPSPSKRGPVAYVNLLHRFTVAHLVVLDA